MALYGQGKTRGKIGVLGIEAATNQACAAISLNRSVSREFIFHFLASQYATIRNQSNTGNQENLNGSNVRSIWISLPPEPEQRAIAAALTDVDALIGALDKLIAKKRDLKQAAMQQLLTPPSSGQAGARRLPGFHRNWEVRRLGDVGEINMGQSQKSSNCNTKGKWLPLIQGNADVENRKTIARIFTTEITKRCAIGDLTNHVRARACWPNCSSGV